MLDSNNLPRSWQVKTLGEVCEKISAGGDRPNDCTTEKTQENQIPIFSNGIENNGLYGYTKIPTITKPALTISARGTIGFVCVRYEPFFPIVRLICAIPNDKVLVLEFLAYALRYLIPQGEGSSIPQLTIPNFKQIKIPIPPLEIQKHIVKRLDEAFSRIENGTKHLKSAKDNLTKYKQSLLKSAFNGTLTQDCPLLQGESATPSLHSKSISQSSLRGSNATEAIHKESTDSTESSLRANEMSVAIHESKIDCHESANADSRNDENSPSLAEGARGWVNPLNDNALDCHADKSAHNDDKDSLNDKSANLPQGWTIKTLGEVCEINPKNKLDDNLEVSFIPMNLILDKFQNKFSYETKIWKNIKKGYTHLQNNCIALAKITPCFENGKCVILDDLKNGYGAGTTELIILLPNAQKAFVKYIFYFLNTQSFIEQGKRNFKGTAGQLRIGTDFVSNCKIPIPPLETQKQIVEILERHFTSADKVGVYIESCLTKAKQLKSSLLKSAFEGKL